MTWAFEAPIQNPGAKFVLVALADHASDHAGEDWACFPSVERLMQFTAQSRATVERHLRWLTGEGWISRRRRRRADGKLGIYDYVLHRTPKPSKAHDHTSNCSMDHTSNCDPAMRQNEGQPHVKMTHQEPPIEPPVEPPMRASEREARRWAEDVWRVWPDAGRRPSSVRLLATALLGEIGAGADPARMVVAAGAYAKDRTAWGASGAPVAAHRFFEEGRWEQFAVVEPGGAEPPRTVFAGPAELRSRFVTARGEPWAVSWIDPCGWDNTTRALLPRTVTAAQRIWSEGRAVLAELGVSVGGRG